jgi:NTP pyrophosphatase (non-canonical NTP hydrolase)
LTKRKNIHCEHSYAIFYYEDVKEELFDNLTDTEIEILANMEKNDLYTTIQEVYQKRNLAQSSMSNGEVKRIFYSGFCCCCC